MLANAGHLQSLINPPGAPKSFFFAAPASAGRRRRMGRAGAARAGRQLVAALARVDAGQRSGDLVDAPAKLGSRKHKPLCAAPGEYVHAK